MPEQPNPESVPNRDDPFFEEIAPPEEPETFTAPRIVVRFFIIPLALVIGVLGIYLFIGWLLGGEKSMDELVRDLHSSYPSTREHALYDITYYIQRHPEARENRAFVQALLNAYRNRHTFRREIRYYLALALGQLGAPEALPVLKEGLQDSETTMVFYTLWALGKIGDSRAGAWVVPFLTHEDAGIREMAAVVLGELRYTPARDALRNLLADPNLSVRINAVFALARMQDPAALPGLRQLGDRAYLASLGNLTPRKMEDILINVILLAPLFPEDAELMQRLETLARTDPNLRVRDAAMKALRRLRGQDPWPGSGNTDAPARNPG